MVFNSSMILAGDIGGTKVNLGLFKLEGARVKLVKEGTYPSQKYLQLQNILRDFLIGTGSLQIRQACFGVAGPVRNGGARLTNLPWRIEAVEIAEELKFGSVSLINDLEANAYGLAQLAPEDFHVLNVGDATTTGNMALISAGTGLGEAGLFWDGRQHHPFACEGGHCDFSPQTKMDAELFAYLNDRFGHVSWEKVLSGSGLHNIYQFLKDAKQREEPRWLVEAMAQGDPARSDFTDGHGRLQRTLLRSDGFIFDLLRCRSGKSRPQADVIRGHLYWRRNCTQNFIEIGATAISESPHK